MKSITILELLREAEKMLQYAKQWNVDRNWSSVAEYMHKTVAVLEIAEVMDCGSVGGYSNGQDYHKRYTVQERLNFLINKYKDMK